MPWVWDVAASGEFMAFAISVGAAAIRALATGNAREAFGDRLDSSIDPGMA